MSRGSMSLGGFRGRGRGRGFTLSPGSTNLDRRPSRILVSGYELEEKEEIVNHFTKYGEIVESVEDEVESYWSITLVALYCFLGDSFHHPEVQD